MTQPNNIDHEDRKAQAQRCIATLQDAANLAAPNMYVQIAFAGMVKNMRANNEPPSAIIRQLLCSMLDGIAVGNWPDNNGL